ncbi:MAG: hypothetical protein BMS9Abin25_1486 [Gammaproteobacteria bacterium]|nr:MAG: hypothetical protein BMS9Abin25_1486 [Gammaproteobacteria bacterium]
MQKNTWQGLLLPGPIRAFGRICRRTPSLLEARKNRATAHETGQLEPVGSGALLGSRIKLPVCTWRDACPAAKGTGKARGICVAQYQGDIQ